MERVRERNQSPNLTSEVGPSHSITTFGTVDGPSFDSNAARFYLRREGLGGFPAPRSHCCFRSCYGRSATSAAPRILRLFFSWTNTTAFRFSRFHSPRRGTLASPENEVSRSGFASPILR